MKRTYSITGLPLVIIIVLGLLAVNLPAAEPAGHKTESPVLDRDIWVSPAKGPAEAPVVIVVFSDFQ